MSCSVHAPSCLSSTMGVRNRGHCTVIRTFLRVGRFGFLQENQESAMLRHCVVSMIRGQPQVTQAFRGGGGRGGGRGGRGNRGPVREKKRDAIMNDEIEADEIRVIGEDKEPLGVMSTDEALAMAKDLEVDLILVVPGATPPVCRLIEYSKFNYEKTKAEKDAKKKQRESVIETKELKMRPGTDVHDYQVKVRAAQKFIDKGFRVKLTLQFRGREMEFKEIGREMFDRFVEDLGGMDQVSIEQAAKMQGRQMNMVLSKKQETVLS